MEEQRGARESDGVNGERVRELWRDGEVREVANEGGLKVGRIVTEKMGERGRFEGGGSVRWRQEL